MTERERFLKWWEESCRGHYHEMERMLAWSAWCAALGLTKNEGLIKLHAQSVSEGDRG